MKLVQGFLKMTFLLMGALLGLCQTACTSRMATMPAAASPAPNPVATVAIPDSNLSALIKNELNLNPSDPITPAGLAAVTELNIWEEGVTNLAGLENCVNLQYLDIEGNSVTNLAPLAGLSHLTTLYLAENAISDLSALANLTDVVYLDLNSNNITNLNALSAMTHLQDLDLHNNSLSGLPSFAGMANLAYLNLSNNHLTDLSALADLTGLETLYIANNNVSGLSALASMAQLQDFEAANNSIADLTPLTGLAKLTTIYLYGNQLMDLLPLLGNTGLPGNHTDLDVRNNPLGEETPEQIATLQGLGLHVSH